MAVDRTRLPDVGIDPSFSFPRITRHRLENGLQVLTLEHHGLPVTTFVLMVEGGSGHDPSGRDGLAGLSADMLDEGTGSLSAIDVSDALVRIGAEFDVEVGPDVVMLTLTTLSRFAKRGASLLADLATRPSLREEDFSRVRQLRLDRLRQLRDLPAATAERVFLRLLYGSHPYGHLSIGAAAALEAMTLDDVTAFHRSSYRPATATLVVAGDGTHDEMRALADRMFGGWRTPDADDVSRAASIRADPVQQASGRLAVVPRERAAQSHLRIGHLAARRDSPDYPALLLMNAVLGGQFVSRINLKLREEKGYTYGARTGFDWRRGLSPFSLETSVDAAATVDAIRDALNELSAIRGDRPVGTEELSLARSSLTRGYPRNFETVHQVARSAAQLVLYGLPDTYFENFVPTINKISADDVTRAAVTYLDPDRLSVLVVGDHMAVGDGLEQLNLGQPQLVSPEA